MRISKTCLALPLALALAAPASFAAGLAPATGIDRYDRICATRLATRLGVPLFTILYHPRDVTETGSRLVRVTSNDGLGRATCEISSRGVLVQVVIQV